MQNHGITIETWRTYAKWLHQALHKTVEETFKSETFNFLFVYTYAEEKGHIMEEQKGETS